MVLYILVDEVGNKIGVRGVVDTITYDYYDYKKAVNHYGFPASVSKLVVYFDGYMWKTKDKLGIIDFHHLNVSDSGIYNLAWMWKMNRNFKAGTKGLYRGSAVTIRDYDFERATLIIETSNGQPYVVPMLEVSYA